MALRLQSGFFLLSLLLQAVLISAQYPPAAGQDGTTAIHTDSSVFVGWASACLVQRGMMDIQQAGLGQVTFGEENSAVGKPEGNSANVVSLGDGGVAILTFPMEISDKTGWDFAVFENSLNDTFLELAFVEVSSDGSNFTRFPAISLTDTLNQVGTFGEVDCTKINNLAGKYRQGYGTPFDLAEMEGSPNLDLQHVTHVRIIDVVGCVQNDFATFDSQENKVNDPWPTPFDSGGFDLDGVGVINGSFAGMENTDSGLKIYPNPCHDFINISTGFSEPAVLELVLVSGETILQKKLNSLAKIDISDIPEGLIIVKIRTSEKVFLMKILKTGF